MSLAAYAFPFPVWNGDSLPGANVNPLSSSLPYIDRVNVTIIL